MAVFILNSECFLDSVVVQRQAIVFVSVKSSESSDNFGCCGHRFLSLCYRTAAKQKALPRTYDFLPHDTLPLNPDCNFYANALPQNILFLPYETLPLNPDCNSDPNLNSNPDPNRILTLT